nr:MAG TPA: minor structural protein [Caudoviricetes sp.]
MLTIEMLRQSSALTGLTDDQLNAIAEMSRNDENTVIGTKIGALHGQYDADILGITGIKKKDGEKSYDYAKRVLGEYKTKAESVKTTQTQLTAAQAQVAELQSKLEKGAGDETLKQQLKDAKAQVTQLQTQLQTKETEFNIKKAEFDKTIKDAHVDYAFQAATAGLKFKSGITEPIQKTLLNAAKAEVLAKGTPDFIEDGQGGKKLVIRGADGNILNNPKNNLNPYTMQELVMETSLKDVIDTGRQQTGGGTGGFGSGSGGTGGTLDLSGIKSQVEADKAIEAHLLANGLTRDSQEFADQSMQLRTENNVASLPIR